MSTLKDYCSSNKMYACMLDEYNTRKKDTFLIFCTGTIWHWCDVNLSSMAALEKKFIEKKKYIKLYKCV